MSEPVYLLYDYLEYLKKKKEDNSPGHLSELIRRFVQNYCDTYDLDRVVESCVLDEFRKAYPDIELNKSYFKKVCSDEWICEQVDNDDGKFTFIYINRKRKRKSRW